MSFLKLFLTEKLSKDRISCSYISDCSSIDSCRAVCELQGFSIDVIRVTIAGEEMKPDKRIKVFGFSELLKKEETNRITSCLLKGVFDKNEAEIVIDFDTDKVKIISNSLDIIGKIKDCLQKR